MSEVLETTPEIVTIFVENHRALLAFLERRVGSRAVAEDLLQEAFVRSAGKLSADDERSVLAWFYRTVKNAAVDFHRRRKTASKALQAFADEPTVDGDADFRAAVCQCVAQLADTLKPEYAEALKRVELDGISVKDYAAEAGLSANNAGVRV